MTQISHTRGFRRVAALCLAALVTGIIVAVSVGPHAASTNALPASLASYARELARQEDIHLRPLHVGAKVRVSESSAIATALKGFLRPLDTNVSAYAVSETNDQWGTPQPDGTLRLKISNLPVWVVLIPSWPIPRHPGAPHSTTVTTTLAVFVDASTGKFLEGVTLAR